jgi:hypothetical protein
MARLPALGFLKRERKRRTEGRAAKQKKPPPKAVENFSEFKCAETKFPSDDVRRRRRRNERKRRVWKLLPDRKILRGDSEPSESQHVSARFSHSSGLCPGDLIEGQSFPLPPSPDDLRYSSLLSFRFPQCISLRLVNVRSILRFKARSTPMCACIMKSRPSAAPIRQAIAVCHSSRSCSAFGNFMMKSAASRRVSCSRPSSRIGSSKGRAQAAAGFNCAICYPPSGMCGTLNWRSFPPLRLPHFLGRLFRFPEPLTELIQFGNLKKEIG